MKTHFDAGVSIRLVTVKQLVALPEYSWLTESALRHHIHQAKPRFASNGAKIAGNSLDPALVRLGRRVLIDLVEFDRWVHSHRDVA